MTSEETATERTSKITKWLSNPYHAALVAVLLFALFIRVYYFFQTTQQPLWWDEAEYMAAARHWAFNVPYQLNPQRPPLFQGLSAILFMIGSSATVIKFLLITIPSLALVYLIYLLGKEMFNVKIGLIAGVLTAASWTLLFWSTRFQPDFLSMSFQVLAVLFMWKFWKTDSTKLVLWAGVFSALGFYFKVSALLVPLTFILFIFVKEGFKAALNKKYYYYSLAFIATLIPYFTWSYFVFRDPFAFRAGYSSGVQNATPFFWSVIPFMPSMLDTVAFIAFIIGLLVAFKFLLYIDILVKDRKMRIDPNIFSICALVVVSAFYIFYIRGIEDRWVFLWLPFMFFLIAQVLVIVYSYLRPYGKTLAAVVMLAVLLGSVYLEVSHNQDLTQNKKDSYLQIAQAGTWIGQHSSPGDFILATSWTQIQYYSDRQSMTFDAPTAADFEKQVAEKHPRYLEASIFENLSPWFNAWASNHTSELKPVQAYYLDAQRQQLAAVIYEFNYNQTS